MAYQQGTATNFWDFFDKLKSFVTSQGWTVNRDDNVVDTYRQLYLQGPGLTGTDDIYIQVSSFITANEDEWNILINGADGFNSEVDYSSQPGLSPNARMLMWNTSMPYWFFVNGRRIIIVMKVGTIYECAYAGLLLPYGTTSEYPYPLYVGGTSDSAARRYSDEGPTRGSFFNPRYFGAYIRAHDGSWEAVAHYSSNGGVYSPNTNHGLVWPWSNGLGYYFRENLDGSYPLIRGTVMGTPTGDADESSNTYGVLEGVFYTTGFGNASENTITVGADTYHVFQSAHRTGYGEFCAILEA